MKSSKFALGVVVIALAAATTLASTPQLTTIAYPERENVSLTFTPTDAAPAKAKLKATVRYEQGQAKIDLSFSGMQPAVLFGGDIAAYVVWAVSKGAAPENLGEMIVDKKGDSGSQSCTTGKKDFALMVTAEPYYLVGRPTDLVVFTSAPADPKKVTGQSFSFDDFRAGPKIANPSIAGMTYDDKTPVVVKQAEAALALAERMKAAETSPDAVKTATVALGEAQAAAKSGGNSKAVSDASRRSISSSAEALRAWGRARDEKAAADVAARQAAEKAALEQKASAAQAETAKTAQALSATEAEKAAIARDREVVRRQRDELAARLSGALGQVADTKQTARGTVTSLSGVLFDTGKTTLKPDAKITLAKLAGVMLVFSKTTMQIEGYTDNVGSEDSNQKLSEARAKSVCEFLATQGIAADRLKAVGKGVADPVAPNDTPDGRAKNRRVEIVSSEPAL